MFWLISPHMLSFSNEQSLNILTIMTWEEILFDMEFDVELKTKTASHRFVKRLCLVEAPGTCPPGPLVSTLALLQV